MSKKILIVDDEADVRIFLATLLKKHGYTTQTANNGKEALDLVKEDKPDLITLDLMMPNQSGTDFYRKLVKDKALADLPIIVVSGLPGRHLAVKKPAAIFDKPIDPDEFIAAIKTALNEED